MIMDTTTFAISYARPIQPLMALLGMGPQAARVVIDPQDIAVHMGWAFRAHIHPDAVQVAEPDHAPVLGWGVHGFRGRWLVNGSSRGMIRLHIEPPAQARVLGFPVRLRMLRLSLVDPPGFLAAVHTATSGR
jgi:hypothetical protein